MAFVALFTTVTKHITEAIVCMWWEGGGCGGRCDLSEITVSKEIVHHGGEGTAADVAWFIMPEACNGAS